MNVLAHCQVPDRPSVAADYRGPCIATIYGFASRGHMQQHLLRFLRASGYPDTTLYGHLQAELIADDLQTAAEKGRAIVLVGFSQGGLETMRVVRSLQRRGIRVNLQVAIASRGLGRWWPHRWHFDMRHVPANVDLCLNYVSEWDSIGTDSRPEDNDVVAMATSTRVENIVFPALDKVSHMAISACYPSAKIKPSARRWLHDRLLEELTRLQGGVTP